MKILYIDDNSSLREFFEDFLFSMGYLTLSCASAEEALPEINEKHFDLIITDYDLPGKNGLEITDDIKRSEPNKNTPVILFTGNSSEELIFKSLKSKVDEVVLKPIGMERLLEILEKYDRKLAA